MQLWFKPSNASNDSNTNGKLSLAERTPSAVSAHIHITMNRMIHGNAVKIICYGSMLFFSSCNQLLHTYGVKNLNRLWTVSGWDYGLNSEHLNTNTTMFQKIISMERRIWRQSESSQTHINTFHTEYSVRLFSSWDL